MRPTIRPLPLSVWNCRRAERSASRSPGFRSSSRDSRDRVEHVGGLDEEDLEELGVEPVGVGGEQSLRLADSAGAGAAAGAPLSAIAVTAASSATVPAVGLRQRLELGQRLLRLRDELGVVDERGVVDEILELRDQRRAGRGVGRRTADLRDELRQHAAQFLDRVLDRLGADVVLRSPGPRPDASRAAAR